MIKEKYTIDFTNVKSYLEMHAVIRHAHDLTVKVNKKEGTLRSKADLSSLFFYPIFL